ncbi:hypothetical protein LguiB_025821 [Lonicera macranthoides]
MVSSRVKVRMASKDMKISETAVSTIVNLAKEAKITSEGVKVPSLLDLLSIWKSLIADGHYNLLQAPSCTVAPHRLFDKARVEGKTAYVFPDEGLHRSQVNTKSSQTLQKQLQQLMAVIKRTIVHHQGLLLYYGQPNLAYTL